MAKFLGEIMNHELFSATPDEFALDVRGYFRTLGISAAPVLDAAGHPLGFVSLSDMYELTEETRVESIMSSPADPLQITATIEDAAKTMAERGRHHLVVVDDDGRAVGYVGSLDVVRGLIGAPTPHPEAFRTYEPTTGTSWSEEATLSMENVERIPDGPGVISLVRSKPGERDRVVWSAGSRNVRTKAIGILSGAEPTLAHLDADLDAGALRFRVASEHPPAA